MTTTPAIPEIIEELINLDQYVEALTYIDIYLDRNGESVNLLLEKARIILMAHQAAYKTVDAERCLVRAHELDRNNLITISLLSRYYAVVDPKPQKQDYYENQFVRIIEKKKSLKAELAVN